MAKLLLTTVFKPFGYEDAYDAKRKENIFDLHKYRLTKGQGYFSMTSSQSPLGIHLIANNINKKTVVLEFPTLKEFIKEIKKGYEYIGISFTLNNFPKVVKMSEIIRQHSPNTKIILGGCGANIPDAEKYGDYICRGEGISFLKKLFKEKDNKNIKHPKLFARNTISFIKNIPFLKRKNIVFGLIVTSLGCSTGCEFCISSAHFNYKHIELLNAEQIINLIREYKEEYPNLKSFWLVDEDFFLNKKRVKELHDLIIKEFDGSIRIGTSGSIKTLSQFSPEYLAEMGISTLWIGIESKFAKMKKLLNKNTDEIIEMFNSLHDVGIDTIASMIIGWDFHDSIEKIKEDIEYLISLEPTFQQISVLVAAPPTKLYYKFLKENRLLECNWGEYDLYRMMHKHPHLKPGEIENEVEVAYKKINHKLGPFFLRSATRVRQL